MTITPQVRSPKDIEEYPFECANPAGCRFEVHVSLSGWVCGYCDPYKRIQNERERMAIAFSYKPAALPERLRRRFGWEGVDFWSNPLPGVNLKRLKAAVQDWQETISANEQIVAWSDRNSLDRHALELIRDSAEIGPALIEAEAELARRAAHQPFPGSVTFDRATYRPGMEPDYHQKAFSYDYEWNLAKEKVAANA
jgi:hypothetical protein